MRCTFGGFNLVGVQGEFNYLPFLRLPIIQKKIKDKPNKGIWIIGKPKVANS